ncbi:unnamed protein product [Rhizophagus irregularis]|nr:unnamed protein product [Rhizophagus irregularis]CAB5362863.1 unnamed protein product [Rhizophagus irregularis]
MASFHDFSTLSWEEVVSKLREVDDLCAKCALKQDTLFAHFNFLPDGSSAKSRAYLAFGPLRLLDDSLSEQKCLLRLHLDSLSLTVNSKNDIAIPPVYDHLSYDNHVDDDLSPLPLAIWTSNHKADPYTILNLCTPSLKRTNHSHHFQRNFFQTNFPDSSIITHISAISDAADYDSCAPPPVLSLNNRPVGFLPTTPTLVLLRDDAQNSSYIFTLRTVLDRWIRPARNVGCNRLYSIRRGNCYFLLDPTPDSDNCYSIHTNSPLLSTTDSFQFISD